MKRASDSVASQRMRRFAFKWTPYRLSRLGKMPDKRLAKTWGVSVDLVRAQRLKLGRPDVQRAVWWTDEMISAVRCRPQRVVMALYGRTEHQVRAVRRQLGLPLERAGRKS